MSTDTSYQISYLVAANSIEKTFYEGWDRYNIEDGHITFSMEPEPEILEKIEKEEALIFYDLKYVEEDIDNKGTTLRIFASNDRERINGECLMEGEMPKSENEIAIDRVFANNNNIAIGDNITLAGKTVVVSGYVALVDYNCLFENNSDMMFNADIFGVGVMTEDGVKALESSHIFWCYAWKYNEAPINEKEENTRYEELIDVIEDVIKDYDTEIVQAEINDIYDRANELSDDLKKEFDKNKLLQIDNLIPKYQNKSITYCMDDMAGDKPMFIVFDYIVVIILAFVFSVNASSTIQKESSVIGTLRASGYTKAELVRHFLFMPLTISVLAAVIGNVLGYTVFVNLMKGIFYNSFSLATYESIFNLEAFIITTVIPLIIMGIINLYMIMSKLKLSPIKFLRRDLSKKKKRRAVLLNKKIPFISRFRLRILFQNVSAYAVMIIGILCGSVVAIFGFMFGPLLSDYADLIVNEKICDYQYVLMEQKETECEGAEKYCITSLDN